MGQTGDKGEDKVGRLLSEPLVAPDERVRDDILHRALHHWRDSCSWPQPNVSSPRGGRFSASARTVLYDAALLGAAKVAPPANLCAKKPHISAVASETMLDGVSDAHIYGLLEERVGSSQQAGPDSFCEGAHRWASRSTLARSVAW